MGRVLAIDHGDKRNGLALSDASRTFATPLKVIVGEREVLSEILRLARDEEVDLIVLGLPLSMDGTVGTRARKVQRPSSSVRSGPQSRRR